MTDSERMQKEIFELLSDPANLIYALELQDKMQEVRERIFNLFWEEVKEQLVSSLKEKYKDKWDIKRKEIAGLDIRHRSHITIKPLPYFRIENLDKSDPYFGIKRHRSVEENSVPEDGEKIIFEKMGKQDFLLNDGWWLGYKYFSKIELPSFDIYDNHIVCNINQDNMSDHSLAQRIAKHFQSVFEDFHEELEAFIEKLLQKQ